MASWINAALLAIERALTRPSCNGCDDGETGPGLDSMPDIRRSMMMNIYFGFLGRAGLIMYLLHVQHNKTSGIAISCGEGLTHPLECRDNPQTGRENPRQCCRNAGRH